MKYAIFPALCATFLSASAVVAQDAEDFVRSNVLAIFYHEFGHALVDLRELPIYGQEEDAADVASVMLMHRLYDDDTANQMVIDTANAFLLEAEAENGEIAYWDVHGASEQRYFNTICIFYGGNPDAREEMITLMGLPEERAETCIEEYEQAAHSWGYELDEIATDTPGDSFFIASIENDTAPITVATMTAEIAALNEDFQLDERLPVIIKSCGEPNAFYDSAIKSIIFCTEFEAELLTLFDTF